MLKRNIRIGDKTPSKISLGKNELTKICLGDKLIWGGVEDKPKEKYVNVTIFILNKEILDDEEFVYIVVGDERLRISKKNNGPFNIKALTDSFDLVTIYFNSSTDSKIDGIECNYSDDIFNIKKGESKKILLPQQENIINIKFTKQI